MNGYFIYLIVYVVLFFLKLNKNEFKVVKLN